MTQIPNQDGLSALQSYLQKETTREEAIGALGRDINAVAVELLRKRDARIVELTKSDRIVRMENRNVVLESRTRIALKRLEEAYRILNQVTSGNAVHKSGEARWVVSSVIKTLENAIGDKDVAPAEAEAPQP